MYPCQQVQLGNAAVACHAVNDQRTDEVPAGGNRPVRRVPVRRTALTARAAADRDQEQAQRDYHELARLALATDAA
jgi:hypothetical protein